MEPRNGTLWSCQAGLNPYKEGRRDIYNVKVKGKGISLGLSAPLNKVQIKLSGEESRYPGENLFKEIYPDEALKQESSNIHGYKKHQKLLHFVSTSMNNKTNLSKESSLLNKKILKISLSQKYAA